MSFIPVMAKLSQHHYPVFSVRWSFRNHSNMLIWCWKDYLLFSMLKIVVLL